MIVRELQACDIPGVINVCKEFARISTLSEVPFIDSDFESFLRNSLGNESIIQMVVISDLGEVVGVCAFSLSSYPFNASEIVANEAWWYIKPEYRYGVIGIRLLNSAIEECLEAGATMIALTLEEHLDQRMPAFYERMGFSKKESTYIKAFKGV